MLKRSLAIAFVTSMMIAPAYADLCNDAHMKQMDDMIAKMTRCRQAEGSDSRPRCIESRDESGRQRRMHEAYGRSPRRDGHVGVSD